MQPVIGPLTPPHAPQAFDPCSGPAALAMALQALDPGQPPWEDLQRALWCQATDQEEMPGAGPSRELWPEEVALAALRRGMHVRLKRQRASVPWLEHLHDQGYEREELETAYERADNLAQGAGLMVTGGQPVEQDLVRAAEAGHPMLLLIDGARRHDEREPFPHWLTIVSVREDQLLLHDPLKEGGPEEGMLSRLPAVQGFEESYALLEIGPGNRLAQRG